MSTSRGPLLAFGPRSLTYDFGSAHPLTPRRFGPGIELLRSVGAEPGLEPAPATDADLERVHLPEYIATVRRIGANPSGPGAMGIGHADNPAFGGMHEAAASVAGGSLAAMEAVLRGDAEHAHHPGGGLHHAMASMASGFCIYNDAAIAVARARAEGLRVLYVDLDVHHGDGVQALTYRDPGVLTLSFHESGRSLFPGSGFPDELGESAAAGTAVNMPFEPFTGEAAWLDAVRSLLPTLAAVFGPGAIVSQHGADAHAWDPLAHLLTTTTAMAEAARLVDGVAHRWAHGRWLATGGGGYDAYRVVPRAWALTWLAGAHREPPDATPTGWRDRWEAEAGLYGMAGMPTSFVDATNAGMATGSAQRAAEERSRATVARVRAVVLPRLVREAEDRGWWGPSIAWAGREILEGVGAGACDGAAGGAAVTGTEADPGLAPTIAVLSIERLRALTLAPRVVSPFDPGDARDLLASALLDGARVVAAVSGPVIVGLAVAAPSATEPGAESLLALGVAPAFRGRSLGRGLLRSLVDGRPSGAPMETRVGVAERDVVEPWPLDTRLAVARGLLANAGFEVGRPSPDLARDDPSTLVARLAPTR